MKTIGSLINPEILQQAQKLVQLDRLLKSTLPTLLHDHVHVIGIRDYELILLADTPAWATRARLHIQDMLYMLQQHTRYNIKSVQIHLSRRHNPEKSVQSTPKPIPLSQHSAKLIRQSADCIKDPELKQALLQLAKRKDPEN